MITIEGAAMKRFPRALCTTFAAAIAFTFGLAFAQTAPSTPAQPTPPKLEPLPEVANDTELEPQVTITRQEGQTIEEGRVNGQLMWIKVTPIHGHPYFLIPDQGGQTYIRRDSLDTGLKVPLWVLFTF